MSSSKTQTSLARYLGSRARLAPLLNKFRNELAESAIFGGMIRDFGLGDAYSFKSDIDIVSMSSSSEIYNLIKNHEPIRNKFGGFRFSYENQLFDIWSFEDTWAFREGILKGKKIEDVCSTTFFTIDAAIYKLDSEKICMEKNHKSAISKRILEINLKENPSPEKMAVRAIRMATHRHMKVSNSLGLYLLEHIKKQICTPTEILFLAQLKRHIDLGKEDPFQFRRQLELWGAQKYFPHKRVDAL